MFTLSLSDSKQQRERKCELGAGVYRGKNLWINTKIMLAKKATFLEVFYMQ